MGLLLTLDCSKSYRTATFIAGEETYFTDATATYMNEPTAKLGRKDYAQGAMRGVDTPTRHLPHY